MPKASVAGGDIHYEIAGSGDSLLMLLPQSSGPVGVAPFLDALAPRFTVIRYDQRGTGKSAPLADAAGYAIDARAGEALGLLDRLEVGRVRFCCHSTGCGIGISLAAAHPERAAGLILVNPWTHADEHLTMMQNLRIAAARTLDRVSYAQFNSSLLFPPDYRRAHAEGFAKIAAEASPPDADTIAARLEAILAFDARLLASRIACPTLVITGADDQLMPPWFGRELAGVIPDAELVELDGGGHMLPETRGEALRARIRSFL